MDAEPARSTGSRTGGADLIGLQTGVFATTDPPVEVAVGSDEDAGPAAAPPRLAAAQVRWRPRSSAADGLPTPRHEPRSETCSDPAPLSANRFGGRVTLAPDAGPLHSDPDGGPDVPESAPAWLAVSRGVAAFLGAFALLTVLGEMRHAGFDANLGWIDLRPLPAAAVRAWLVLAGMLLVAFAFRPMRSSAWRGVTTALVVLLLAAAVWNTLDYYGQLRRGTLHSGPGVPFSLHVATCLVVVLAGTRCAAAPSERPIRDALLGIAAFSACLLAFPLAQMYCFGRTDHRRPADVVVVFGWQSHTDGTSSEALADRVETACRLYQDGLAKRLILSGGPGPGSADESEAMRKLAIERGIPPEVIEIDPIGVNTEAAAASPMARLPQNQIGTVLAVSHFYHLPRVRLCYRRAGIEVYTVPAAERRPLERQGWLVLREFGVLWREYLRPVTSL